MPSAADSAPRTAGLLACPAAEAVRRVALGFLADATAAESRLRDGADDEALHAFRVALRRLRSLLRAYRRELDGGVPGKLRRRVGAVARATSAARDLEVQVAWVRKTQRGLSQRRRHGARWLGARLADQRAAAFDEALAGIARRFPPLHRKLERALRHYTVHVRLDRPAPMPSMAAATALLLERQGAELRERLAAVAGVGAAAAAHEARIAGKRLRYLLEPIADEVPAAKEAVHELKWLQDELGAAQDAAVFGEQIATAIEAAGAERAGRLAGTVRDDVGVAEAERELATDPLPGLLGLAERLHDQRSNAVDRVAIGWPGDRADAFFASVASVARALHAAVHTGVEIERKFLLRALPSELDAGAAQTIDQGYLPGERLVERIRRIESAEGTHYVRTVKDGTGIARLELEEEASAELFDALWPLTAGRRVRKCRYSLPDGDRVWEVDSFTDRDLVLAEVELPSADVHPTLPDWLAPYVVREVTGDDAYVNANLAR